MTNEPLSLTLTIASIVLTLVLGAYAVYLSRQQGAIITRVDNLQTAIAETQLKEKITVICQRGEMFKRPLEHNNKHRAEEAVTLRGDIEAALSLFRFAGEATRSQYTQAVCDAGLALGKGHVEGWQKYRDEICECLTQHVQLVRDTKDAAELRRCADTIKSGLLNP